jgi:hypothetical protein
MQARYNCTGAQFFKMIGGMPEPEAGTLVDIQILQNALDLIWSKLKRAKRWVIRHVCWARIRRHPGILEVFRSFRIISGVLKLKSPQNIQNLRISGILRIHRNFGKIVQKIPEIFGISEISGFFLEFWKKQPFAFFISP